MTVRREPVVLLAERVAEASLHAFTSARIAAGALAGIVPKLPSKDRVIAEQVRSAIAEREVISDALIAQVRSLIAAVDRAVEDGTTEVLVERNGDIMLAPGRTAPPPQTERRLSADAEQLSAARPDLADLSERVAHALDAIAAARMAHRLLRD